MSENNIVRSAAFALAFRRSLSISDNVLEIAAEIATATEFSSELVLEIIIERLVDIDAKAEAILKLFG